MTTRHAEGTFRIQSWDEGPYAEVDGAPKLTRAHVTSRYGGGIEGEGTSETLMFYPEETTATYSGFERVVGRLDGREGTFVLSGSGTYENGAATTRWSVVPGSGTGELSGLRGEGGFVAGQGADEVAYRLDYDLD